MPKSLKVIKSFIHIPKAKNVKKHYLACANTAVQGACRDGVTMIEKYRDEYAGKVTESKGR